MRVSFDIGGVLSKYPSLFRPMFWALASASDIEVFVITDMKDHAKVMELLRANEFPFPPEKVLLADYDTHGEHCKTRLIEEYLIDMHFDDHPGYCNTHCLTLFTWPNPDKPYFADDWRNTDESGFGRSKPWKDKQIGKLEDACAT